MATPIVALARLLEDDRSRTLVRGLGRALLGAVEPRRRLGAPLVPAERHRVSVIMPSYGYADHVEAAIASAAIQEGVDVEVVVVDDCGPDDSLARARAEARRHPQGRVTVLANERNLGHARTFDRGYHHSTGEFVVRLDADDVLAPGALARAVAVMEAAPSVGLVYGPVLSFTSADEPVLPDGDEATATIYAGQEWMRRALRQGRNLITTPEAMLRRSVCDEVGGWDLDLPHQQDLEIWLRTAAVSDVAHLDGCYQAAKREHPRSMSNTAGMVGMMAYTGHRDAVDVLFRRIGHRIPDGPELAAQARRRLADEAVERAVSDIVRDRRDPALEVRLEEFAREQDASPAALRRLARAQRLGSAAQRDPILVARTARLAATRQVEWAYWRTTGL